MEIERIKDEIVRHGTETLNLGLKLLVEARNDLNASQRMVRWIENTIKIVNEKIVENQIKAKRALDFGEDKLAREIIFQTKIFELLVRKLVNVRERIRSKEGEVLKAIKKAEFNLNKIDEHLKSESGIGSLNYVTRQVYEGYRSLILLEKRIEMLNRTINLGRDLVEKAKKLIENGILTDEIENLLKTNEKEEIYRLVSETLERLKRI